MVLLPHLVWHSTHFSLTLDSTSLLYLFLFSLFSISCIVIATIASPSRPTCPILPVSASQHEQLHAVTQFLNFYSTSNISSNSTTHTQTPPNQSELSKTQTHTNSPESLHLPTLDEAVSKVTLTFGSDKPEVYMKMAQHARNSNFLCRCPCNHQSPELAPFPHVSNHFSTISSDLTGPHTHIDPMDIQDSLSSIASNRHHIILDNQNSHHMSPKIQPEFSPRIPVSDWVIINDLSGDEQVSVEQPKAKHMIVKNELPCKMAHAKMRALVPFIDPAIVFHWIALKIMVSIYVLAKGLYDRAVDNPVVRKFHE